jgi:hypothetical protein
MPLCVFFPWVFFLHSYNRDDSDVTSSGGSGIIIRGRNGYEWFMNEPKKMNQSPRRNIVVVQPGNKGEAQNCKKPIEAWNLLFPDSILQKVLLHTNEEIVRTAATYTYKQKTSYSGKTTMYELNHSLVCCIWRES